MGLFSRRSKPTATATPEPDAPDFLSRAEARAALDKQEREAHQERIERRITFSKAIDAAKSAQEWLDTHPKTHSARKRDVKALIAAIADLSTLVDISDIEPEDMTANKRVAEGDI